jgi:hypothetical protein
MSLKCAQQSRLVDGRRVWDGAVLDEAFDRFPVDGDEKIAWRGLDRIDGALGLSWTTKCPVACFFAIRSRKNTPFVFKYEFHPDDIGLGIGRHEHELIVDPLR